MLTDSEMDSRNVDRLPDAAHLLLTVVSQNANANKKREGSESVSLPDAAVNSDIPALLSAQHENDINQTNPEGETALFVGCKYGHTDIVALLLGLGADPNIPDNTGLTPRDVATIFNRKEIIRLLVEKGTSIDKREEKVAQQRTQEIFQVLTETDHHPKIIYEVYTEQWIERLRYLSRKRQAERIFFGFLPMIGAIPLISDLDAFLYQPTRGKRIKLKNKTNNIMKWRVWINQWDIARVSDVLHFRLEVESCGEGKSVTVKGLGGVRYTPCSPCGWSCHRPFPSAIVNAEGFVEPGKVLKIFPCVVVHANVDITFPLFFELMLFDEAGCKKIRRIITQQVRTKNYHMTNSSSWDISHLDVDRGRVLSVIDPPSEPNNPNRDSQNIVETYKFPNLERLGNLAGTTVVRKRWFGPSLWETFSEAVKLLREVRHNNFIKIVGGCVHPSHMMLFMEHFCDHGNLRNVLLDFKKYPKGKSKELGWENKQRMLREIADAMNYLHNHYKGTILYKNLSTRKILLRDFVEKPLVKLTDFVSSVGDKMSDIRDKADKIEEASYMPPEVLAGQPWTTASDVYRYGMLSYYIGTRNSSAYSWLHQRSSNETIAAINQCVMNGSRPLLNQMPPNWSSLIKKCISHNIMERPSFEEIISILDSWPRSNILATENPNLRTIMLVQSRPVQCSSTEEVMGYVEGATDPRTLSLSSFSLSSFPRNVPNWESVDYTPSYLTVEQH